MFLKPVVQVDTICNIGEGKCYPIFDMFLFMYSVACLILCIFPQDKKLPESAMHDLAYDLVKALL
jgi:hypothetical protein